MPRRIDPAFLEALAPRFAVKNLDLHPSSVVGLWSDLRIAYFNLAWSSFAEANGGQPAIARSWGVGARYLDAVPEPLLPFYRALFERAVAASDPEGPIVHAYECSSAIVLRCFIMEIYVLPNHSGVLVMHSLLFEHPMARPIALARRARYADAGGALVQCAHCRRVQRAIDPPRWDWVPAWVARVPPATRAALCERCSAFYYPSAAIA